ncbi:MAG: transglycosylase SLT domain-containing protein, partial [bacterium]
SDPMTLFLEGVYLTEAGKAKDAVQFLKKSSETADFPLPEYRQYYLARALVESGHPTDAAPLLDGLKANDQTVLSARVYSISASAAVAKGDPEGAGREVTALLNLPSPPEEKADALSALINYHTSRKEYEQAYLAVNDALLSALNSTRARRSLYQPPVLDKYEAYRKLTLKQKDQHYRAMYAILTSAYLFQDAEDVATSAPDSVWKFRELGDLAFTRNDYLKSERYYNKGLALAKAKDDKADIRSRLAKTSARQEETKKALGYLDALAQDRAAEAIFRKADYLASLGQSEQALPLFQQVMSRYPDSSYAESAQFWLFQYYMRQGKQDEAAGLLTQFKDEGYAPFVKYWRTKILETGDDGKLLIEQHPYSFYALQMIKESPDTPDLVESILSKGSSESAPTEVNDRFETLRDLGLATWLYQELSWQTRGGAPSPRELYTLAKAYYLAGDYRDAILTSENLLKANVTKPFTRDELTDIFRIAFPLGYYDLVEREAKANDLDPLLVLSVIRQESSFEPMSTSYAKARGLMQIIESTGRSLMKSLHLPYRSPDILYDSEVNIKAGTHYLRKLVNAFDGNLVLALAAYNWGPGSVRNWYVDLPTSAKSNEVMLIDMIPNSQPRIYVKKVLFNYWIYSALWEKGLYKQM